MSSAARFLLSDFAHWPPQAPEILNGSGGMNDAFLVDGVA
jgi:hypothetical protein